MNSTFSSQLYFAIAASAATILFHVFMTDAENVRDYTRIWLIPFAYFIVMFAAGWWLGRRARKQLPLASIAVRFHAITFLSYTGITVLWSTTFGSISDLGSGFIVSTGLWFVGLIIHTILFRANSSTRIRGLKKENLFE